MDLVAAQPDCEKCNRHEECGRPGIPSRLGDVEGGNSCSGPALFVIGEQPGFYEEKAGRCFVGRSGAFLRDVYLGQEGLLTHFSAIYLGNAIRCQHRRNIAVSHLGHCRPYLMADIRAILEEHGSLVLLALGRAASQCLLNRGLRDAFKIQGQPLPDAFWVGYPRSKKGDPPLELPDALLPTVRETKRKAIIPTFATYHPAALMSGRNPSYRRAVFDQLSLLCRAMETSEHKPASGGPLAILADVTWTRPGGAHRIPEID